MEPRAIEAITVLLNSYRLPSDTDKDMLLRTYVMAVEELSADAICEAAKRFIRGDVTGQDKRFAPSTAEFASEARGQQATINAANRPLPPPEPEADNSQRVPASWMQALTDWVAGKITAARFTEITGKKVD